MRAYVAHLNGDLHDLRACQETYPQIYHPTDYSAGQSVGARLRDAKSNGIIYVSVRQAPEPPNTCVAVFRPPCLSECRQERHLTRSEEPTSELQSLMRISYAVFSLTTKRLTI